jgi:RHS repeat-associated protein
MLAPLAALSGAAAPPGPATRPVTAPLGQRPLAGPSAQPADFEQPQSLLYGVSCPTSTFCAAVGHFGVAAMAEVWNGGQWSVQVIPSPSLPAGTDNPEAVATGVSCTSSTFCMAVGTLSVDYITPPSSGSEGESVLFADQWNGHSWIGGVLPAGDESGVNGVSCSSASSCIAVGAYGTDQSGGISPLADSWDGATWSAQTPFNPSTGGEFQSVSCLSASICIAVGADYAGNTLAEEFNVSGWEDMNAVNPVSGGHNSLWSVSCTSQANCTAVGDADTGDDQAIAEIWNGVNWVASTPASVGGANSYLQAVSCLTAKNCYAGGWNSFGPDEYLTMVQVRQGSTWAIQSAPNGASSEFDQLYGISCASATSCAVVGGSWDPEANDGAGTYVPILLQWDGTVWSTVIPPQLPPIDGAPQPSENPADGNPSESGVCSAQGSAADPCNTADGSFSLTATDLSLAGRGPVLGVTRTYSSVLADVDGPLGYGWSLNLAAHLSLPAKLKNGSVVTFAQENGAQVTFTDGSGGFTPPPRVQATLTHNADGSWTVVRDAQITFAFTSKGLLTSETDLNGHALTFKYSGTKLTTVTDDAGRKLTLGWSGTHVVSITDPNVTPHRTVHYGYDSSGDLTSVTDVNGGVSSFTYATHLMTADLDPACTATPGCTGTVVAYNGQGRVAAQTDPLGHKTTFAYRGNYLSATGGTTLITDPSGHQTLENYQYGLRIAFTTGYATAEAATTTLRYDPTTLALTSSVDPDGHTTTMTYDANGNIDSETDPLGGVTTWTYNDLNEQVTVTDPKGITTTDTYDNEGNLTGVSTPCSDCNPSATQTTTYAICEATSCSVGGDTYAEGDIESMTDPDGDTTTYGYDRYGDQASVTDPDGDTSTDTFNADGWLLTSVAPDGNVPGCGCAAGFTTTDSYVIPGTGRTDGFGDVQTVTDPLGHVTTYAYDPDRHIVSETDADGATTTTIYDLDGLETQVTRPGGTSVGTDYTADGAVADYRNGAGTVIDTYQYDPLGRLSSVTDALGNETSYTYDAAGNLSSKQAPGGNCAAIPATGCTTYGYDADSQLTAIAYSDGVTPDVGLGYDPDGQRTSMTDGTGSWNWTYDSLHRVTSVTEGNYGTVSFGYDLRGSLAYITYPNEQSVEHGYDAAGRWTSVTDWLGNKTSFGYDANGNLLTETLPTASGVVDAFGYNGDGAMTSASVTMGTTPLFTADYGRDGDELVSSDTSQPASGAYIGYTTLGQLCSTAATPGGTCSSGTSTFAYDAADDPTTVGGTTQAFNADDELCWSVAGTSSSSCADAPAGATTYAYNTSGERTTVAPSGTAATTLSYNEAGGLSGVSGPAGTATYDDNGDGLLMGEVVSKKTTGYTWDLSGSLPLLLTSGATSYVNGPEGLPLEQINGSKVLWLHHDQLGSTRLVTGPTGAPVATYSYGPTGTLGASTGTVDATQLRFAGQFLDPISGLYLMRARDYDPATDQFVTSDPLATLTRQPYEYADDDPVNQVDPSGLGSCPDGVGIPFTDLCIDSPTDLSQYVQNFNQNSADLDNSPVGGFLQDFDPFYGDIRDGLYWIEGCQINVSSDIVNTASTFAPGASAAEGVLHEGGEAAFAGTIAEVTNYKVGAVLYNHQGVIDTVGSSIVEAGIKQIPGTSSPSSGCSCSSG